MTIAAVPIFNLGDTFPATVLVGRVVGADGAVLNEGTPLPIHVKRFSRPEIDDFEKKWAALIAQPRGSAEIAPADAEKRALEQLAFFEEAIRAYVTVDEGLLVNRGKPVTDGAGVIDMFYARKDVLSAFMAAIYVENRLGGVMRKNSNSPRGSDGGSEQSIPARGGDGQGPTAGSVDHSTTASAAVATDASSEKDDASASSGAPDDTTRVH